MKRFANSMLGVTLLEIMLVLAIAAMIVVMSIRYYQSASSSQQANTALSQVQAVMAAMDNLGASGGYSANYSAAALASIVGSANMISPTGGTITVAASSASTYTATVPLNTSVCPNVAAKLNNTSNPKITSATCSGGDLTFSYNNTQ